MSELELDRARKDAQVDEVISTSKISKKLKVRGVEHITTAEMVHFLLKERRVTQLLVPANFPVEHADTLRAKGYTLRHKPDPFFDERTIKTKTEIEAIGRAQQATE